MKTGPTIKTVPTITAQIYMAGDLNTARAAIALADREAAERAKGPSARAVELVAEARREYEAMRNAPSGIATPGSFHVMDWADKPHRVLYSACALIKRLADHIVLAEAGGAVPEELQSANESPVSRAMISARQGLCMCGACVETRGEMQVTMHVCPACGNKRCPKAQDHRFRCSGSNEVGQTGELEDAAAPRPPAAGSEKEGGGHGD